MERMIVRVRDRRQLARGVREIDLERPDGELLPSWSAGAHIDIELANGMVRQYSLCGRPGDQQIYRIAVLAEETGRGGSQFIHHRLRAGDELAVLTVRNTFPLTQSERSVLVAGGIGITPLLSMIYELDHSGAEWELHYGGRSREEMAFLDEVTKWEDRVTVYPQTEVGLLPLNDIVDGCRDQSTTVYACGPPAMLSALEAQAAGQKPVYLRVERFAGPEPHDTDSEFTVVLANSGHRVPVSRTASLLEAIEEIGIDVMSSCRSGICGTCEIGVVAGEPDHRDHVLTEAEKAAGKLILPCVSRSRTAVLELDL